MANRGTSTRSKTEFNEEVENMGARFTSETEREWTRFGMQCFSNDTARAVSVLGDIVSNNNFNSAEFELCKEAISNEHEDNHNRYEETTLENVHFNAFREHMLGQPIKGDRDLTQSITLDGIRDFHTANYYGDNITVVATGDVNHEQIVDSVQQAFHALPKTTNVSAVNTEKPVYIPGLLMIRDDEMYNSNIGVFYDAPSARDEDYYAFLLLQNMFGEYRIDRHAEHLNDVHKQYNSLHALIG